MDLKQVKQAVNLMWRLKRDGKILNLPIPTLVGDTGIGKSTILQKIMKEEKGADYLVSLFLAQMEVGDLIGMPDKAEGRLITKGTKGEEGYSEYREAGKTVWLAPDWFPEHEAKGLLVLDELGDSDSMTRKAIMPLLLTGELHSHRLPQEVMLVCAMNPIGGNFGGVGFTKQFQNRLMFWKVTPSIDEWLAFAEKRGLAKYVKSMVAEQPSFFEDQNETNLGWQNSPLYDGMPSRRSVTAAAEILTAMSEKEIQDFGDELLTSIVGPAAAGAMLTYKAMNIEEVMNAEDLFKDTANMLAKVDSWLQDNDIAKVSAFLRLVKAHLVNTKSIKDINVEALGKLLVILSEDMIAAMLFFIRHELPYHFEFLVALAEHPELFAKVEAVTSKGA